MEQIEYLTNLDNNTKVIYISIAIFILYFCIFLLKVELGHILAFFLIVFVIYIISYNVNKQTTTFNTDIDAKLDGLLDLTKTEINNSAIQFENLDMNGYNLPPEYMYLDANLIEIFDDIKNTFYQFNPEAYIRALLATNVLLKIKYDFELPLSSPPKIPFLLDNYLDNYNVSESPETIGKYTLENGYSNYQLAQSNCKLALNHLQSMIVTIPSIPVSHLKFRNLLKQTEILLKRNLDYIYNIYKIKRNPSDPIITDYDMAKPINSFTEIINNNQQLESSFDFY
jgi:hypothetical protein